MGNIILNVQHLLCFTKMCFMGEIFDKNSFIFGKKLNALKNFLLMDERKVEMFDLFDPGRFFSCSWKLNISIFMGRIKNNSLCWIALNVCQKQIFISYHNDIRGLLPSQVYLRYFTNIFYFRFIWCNTIS